MSSPWQPENFRDTFSEEVMALVHKKVEAGQTEQVVQPEAVQAPAGVGADIIDLAALLQRSLKPRNAGGATRPPKPSGHAAGHEKHAAGKSPARRHHA
jgi:DNA end-binding protein Ku